MIREEAIKKVITRFQYTHISWGPIHVDDVCKNKLVFYPSGLVRHTLYNVEGKIHPSPNSDYRCQIKPNEMNSFFTYLLNQVEIDSWADDYEIDVCDGSAWRIRIAYSDKTKKLIKGNYVNPPNVYLFNRAVLNLVDYQIKPRMIPID